ncbi:MAG TPA: orotidine-5'-phosphate decarboxylase [Acidiphilium sp.]
MIRPHQRLIAAIDTADPARARDLIRAVAPHCGLVKLGLEAFCAIGPAILDTAEQKPVFLDLKLHDIPNTVAGAVRALLPRRPAMLTLHANGGAAMIEAARNATETAGAERPILLAVTVLTSFSAQALAETGVADPPREQVLRLARLALDAGADGLVCSPAEIEPLRDAFGAAPVLVVPGIRPHGSAIGDQARIATPEEAVASGADYIVVGRPITGAADPEAAAAAIASTIS